MSTCPHCGEDIEDEAPSCPHCGSDYETGWNPDADYQSLELPSYDDEDDEYFADPYSFGGTSSSGGSSSGGSSSGGYVGGTRGHLAGGPSRSSGIGATIGSFVVLIVTLGLVAAAGFPAYGWGVLGPVALLVACAIYFRRISRRSRQRS